MQDSIGAFVAMVSRCLTLPLLIFCGKIVRAWACFAAMLNTRVHTEVPLAESEHEWSRSEAVLSDVSDLDCAHLLALGRPRRSLQKADSPSLKVVQLKDAVLQKLLDVVQ